MTKYPFLLFILLCNAVLATATDDDNRLINGKPADPKEWPASVYASMSGSRCSATAVAEKTLLIASHCVSHGGTASFSVGPNRYTSRCSRCPQYSGNSTADWALCLVDKPITGIPFEQINSDSKRFNLGDELTLTGYGCTKAGGGGGNDGVYRVGTSKIVTLPKGNNNDIVTKGGAALCFGDSGGPTFFVDKTTNERWIAGINSRGNISTTSYLPSLSSETAQKFMADWSQKYNQRICGVHSDAQGCRISTY